MRERAQVALNRCFHRTEVQRKQVLRAFLELMVLHRLAGGVHLQMPARLQVDAVQDGRGDIVLVAVNDLIIELLVSDIFPEYLCLVKIIYKYTG